jgi:uncharacterized protein YndB with AHSA1/START domain
MEYGSIEREITVEASPEIVFDVVSSPEHLEQWWPDEATLVPTPGNQGTIVFNQGAANPPKVVNITVVEVQPPRRFSFRWDYESDVVASVGNSMLITFELEPIAGGTRIRMTETGFRERGWEAAVLEEIYQDHSHGWDYFIARLEKYLVGVGASS